MLMYLLDCLSPNRSREIEKLRIIGPLGENPLVMVDSPHNGPALQSFDISFGVSLNIFITLTS